VLEALDIMRSADAEPNGSKAFDSHDCYRLSRAADRSAEHDRYFSSATSGSEVLHRLVRLWEVRAATGFHDDLAGSKMHEEAQKFRAGQPLALRDPPIRTRNGELEDIFCQVDTNDRSIHIGLLLVRAFAETLNMLSLAHRCRTAIQEESISTVRVSFRVGAAASLNLIVRSHEDRSLVARRRGRCR
jgi:hypothetical protein